MDTEHLAVTPDRHDVPELTRIRAVARSELGQVKSVARIALGLRLRRHSQAAAASAREADASPVVLDDRSFG
jgi:hypothetical protein